MKSQSFVAPDVTRLLASNSDLPYLTFTIAVIERGKKLHKVTSQSLYTLTLKTHLQIINQLIFREQEKKAGISCSSLFYMCTVGDYKYKRRLIQRIN